MSKKTDVKGMKKTADISEKKQVSSPHQSDEKLNLESGDAKSQDSHSKSQPTETKSSSEMENKTNLKSVPVVKICKLSGIEPSAKRPVERNASRDQTESASSLTEEDVKVVEKIGSRRKTATPLGTKRTGASLTPTAKKTKPEESDTEYIEVD